MPRTADDILNDASGDRGSYWQDQAAEPMEILPATSVFASRTAFEAAKVNASVQRVSIWHPSVLHARARLVDFAKKDAATVLVSLNGMGFVPAKARNVVALEHFWHEGDADYTAAFARAKTYIGTLGEFTGRAVIECAAESYTLNADVTGCHGLKIKGRGSQATEFVSATSGPVFYAVGSAAEPLNKFELSGCTIRGGGNDNANAHGVSIIWGHQCKISDVLGFGCRHILDLHHQWQTRLDNVRGHGAGADASYIGLYMGASTAEYVDNAVIATGLHFQANTGYGFRLINFQGSKFSDCEAGGSPTINAWYIGDPGGSTVPVEWGHFVNCLGDSTSGPAWLVRQGTASRCGNMQFTGCWGGNGQYGGYFDGVTNSALPGWKTGGNTRDGLLLNSCAGIAVTGGAHGGTGQHNNEENSTSYADIRLQNSSYCTVAGNACRTSGTAGKSIIEAVGSDNNTITGNVDAAGSTIVGASTRIGNNTAIRGRASGSVTITAGATSANASFTVARTPSIDQISVTPRTNLSGVSWWITAATASGFTINLSSALGGNVTFAFTVDVG